MRVLLVFADKKYPYTKGTLWGKTNMKYKTIVKRVRGTRKGKKISVIHESTQLTFLQVILEEANLSRNLLIATTNKVRFEPVYKQRINLNILI